MNKVNYLRKAIIGSIFGAVILSGGLVANAQNTSREYRQWQEAQRRAQQELADYQRTGSRRDYREWQDAQRHAQQEYADYQRATNSYNSGYYNNGYYNRNENGRINGNPNGYYNNGGYRVYRNGSSYETNSQGAALLRQAVQRGYQQGYREGQADKRYNRGYSYNTNNVYMSGNYGYQSYVASNQYQYYFQQGFQKGYEDGYRNTRRYGNGSNILGSILNTIINFTNN